MTLTVNVQINNREVTQAQLDHYYYQRALHVLHEMHDLGATIEDSHGETLPETAFDTLTPEVARQLLLDNKLRLGTGALKTLYADKLKESDQMWADMVAHSNGDYRQKVSRALITVSGINILKMGNFAKDAGDDPKVSLGANPEHFEVTNDATGQHGMETMGMYGEPTAMDLTMKGVDAPEPVNKKYLKRLIGSSVLAHDPEIVNAYAMHQIRPTLHGIEVLSGAYFPSAAPQALVDGHAIHLAIEFSNMFKSMN